jgi:outer membrane protein OmpA-like peptidoglycan-associated protein/tetratricopeptide (TPR) repeat protein
MTRHLLLVTLFFCFGSAVGQSLLKKANTHFETLAYTEAAAAYDKYLAAAENPDIEVLLRAAEANYNIGKTTNALLYYDKVFARKAEVYKQSNFLHYIDVLRIEGQYDKADALLWKNYTDRNVNGLDALTTQKKYLDSLGKTEPKFKVENLAVNSRVADFGAVFYGNKVVYASAKDSIRDGGKMYDWNKQPYLELYVADRNDNGSFKNEKKFLANAQTGYHNAAVAFSPINKMVFISVNNVSKKDKLKDSKDGTNNIQLMYGILEGDRLTKKQFAAFNSADYSVGQPAVSADGNYLYFVSDMPGGYGGTDIYVAPLYDDGTIGKPTNLGETINTQGNEMFPFATADAFYFSSNGHYGLGGLDVFVIKTAGEAFTLPQNMGRPINSNRDDFSYIVSANGACGYLSSNRAGGRGDDDMYYFKKDDAPCSQLITGRVINKKTGQPIEGVAVKAQVKGQGYSDTSKADGSYTIDVPCGSDMIMEATKEGYTLGKPNDKNEVELSAYADLVRKTGDIEMIDINPIYFDFDQYYITPQAAAELDKVVFVMQNFPNVVIKIESHTDSRGNDAYNLRLSDDRAKSTYSYIMAKGIDPKRIESVKGYGETRLLNKCSNDVPCTDEAHQLNRRSDFIIVKK